MKFVSSSSLTISEKLEILALWNREYPVRLAYKSVEEFNQYLKQLKSQSHILIFDQNDKIRAWYFDFIRDNEKWFAMIIDSKLQRQGLGSQILSLAKAKESQLNGWVIDHNKDQKINGESYNSPLPFYLKNGFKKIARERLELPHLSAVKIKWEK